MLRHYLKVALAVFRRRKFFTFVYLFSITITLSILMITLAFLDYTYGSAPPEVHQSRSLGIYNLTMVKLEGGVEVHGKTTYPSFAFLDRNLRELPGAERVSIISLIYRAHSFVEGRRIDSYLKFVDDEFWEIMRFDFMEGRPFTREEYRTGAQVAVINQAIGRRFFGSESPLGRTIPVAGRTLTVVGVVRNVSELRRLPFSDIWAPLSTSKGFDQPKETWTYCQGIILARSREDFGRIRAEFAARMAAEDLSLDPAFDHIVAIPETRFENTARYEISRGFRSERQTTRYLARLILFMLLFTVLPTLNLINLNISRIRERASEIGVRKAFGAPAVSLAGQLLLENALLTALGGILAVGAAFGVMLLVTRLDLFLYASIYLSLRLLVYTLATALVLSLLPGIYPAWRMARLSPVEVLRGGAP